MRSRAASGSDGVAASRWGTVGLLTGAHLLHDASLGTLGVFLPFLRERLGFSLFLAGLLVPAQQAGSLLQPAMGYLADTYGKKRFVVTFLTVTSVSMSLLGLSFSYVALLVIVMLGGLSSAAYHPAGSALVTSFAGRRWGTGLAIYHFGGNIGLAAGPLGAAWVVEVHGLSGNWMLMLPALLWAPLVLAKVPTDSRGRTDSEQLRSVLGWVRQHWTPFAALAAIVLGRSIGAGGLGLFLPTLLLQRDYSIGVVALITSSYFAIGGAGGLLMGSLSDRFGRHRIIRVMLVAGPAMLLLFLGSAGAPAIVFLLGASISLKGEQPVIMALIQEWAPTRRGTIVGLVLGLQFVLGGLGTALIGYLADSMGLVRAFQLVALFPLIGLPFVRRLPEGLLGSDADAVT
ncbi:MAG: MFS transporter [Acidimicrobiia bacterium]